MRFYRILKLVSGWSVVFFLSAINLLAQPWDTAFYKLNHKALLTSLVDERVIMATDRETYLSGEQIFFNSFVYDGNWDLPLSMSSVLYVELYDQYNSVIFKGKYSLVNGKCSGVIPIAKTVDSNIFYIRAYTNYMKNYGLEQFSVQKIRIVNPFLGIPAFSEQRVDKKGIQCNIHPESGRFIEGIKTLAGCIFFTPEGDVIKISNARLLDMNDSIIDILKTYANGLNSFEFTPEPGEQYEIELENENALIKFPLPQIAHKGTCFSIDSINAENILLTVHSNDSSHFPLSLTVKKGRFSYPIRIKNIDTEGSFSIPVNTLPTGIISLELSDAEWNILASRLLYNNPHEKLLIGVKTDKEKYSSREKVDLEVTTKYINKFPAETDLIIFTTLTINSLRTEDTKPFNNGLLVQELMQTYNYKLNFISGIIEDNRSVDLLLLATPPKNQYLSPHTAFGFNYMPESAGDIITGKVIYKDNQPAGNTEILKSFIGNTSWIESAFTDEEGKFFFLNRKQSTRGDIVLKAKNPEGEVTIMFDDEFYPAFSPPTNEILRFTKDEIDLISRQFINIQVEDAFADENPANKGFPQQEPFAFYGKEYEEFVFKDYFNLPNMKEFLQEIIEGVSLHKEDKNDVLYIRDKLLNRRIGQNPLMIIDGVPVDESVILNDLTPEAVRLVRIVRHKYFYRNQIFDGILDIITYAKDASDFSLPVNTFRFKFEPVREAEILAGSIHPFSEKEGIPAYKNMLYWNSGIRTDHHGKSFLSFYTPDNYGLFEIHFFGRTKEGYIGSIKKYITVGE
jgi:hypothetical protein